jgi:predicted MFS family arabinose efflux permease
MLQSFRDSLRLLGTRRFGTFWFSSLLSSIGTWAQQVAEPWLLLSLGASSFVIGLDSFAMNAPVLALTLVGGMLADRADRRRVIALFQSLQMLCPVVIVALLIAGRVHAWEIVCLSVIVGITDALSMPSFQSIVPSIVRREEIGTGLALNATQFNLSRILGPSVAGVLMSSVGVMACFVVSAISYVPFIGVALWILPRGAQPRAGGDTPGRNPFAGVGVILRSRHLLGALLTVLATSVLCAPLVTFSPVLVKDAFQGGASRFSITVAAFGVGGVLGAVALLGIPAAVDRRRVSAVLALACGAMLVLLALSPWFWGTVALFALAGAALTISNTAANSLLQVTAGPRLLGQTVSLYMLAMRGGISLGALVTGVAVGWVGVRHALLLDGIAAIAIEAAIVWMWLRAPMPIIESTRSVQEESSSRG